MTQNKYAIQANSKYNDVFINKFEKPSNIIQKRLQKSTTITNDDDSRTRANKTGYANLINEYKKLGITTMPNFDTYDVNDPNYMDKYDPQKALAAQNETLNAQKHNKIWNSLTPQQQYAYTTLADSAKTLDMEVPAIENVDLSNPFWLAKTLNEINEKITYLNFKGSFDANKAYAFDQFKQEKMYYDDRNRMNDAATWQKMWDESAQSKLWTDAAFNSQWNQQLVLNRMQNGLWDLSQWGKNGRGGASGGEGGNKTTTTHTTTTTNSKNITNDEMINDYINNYLNGQNQDGPNGESIVYQRGTPEYEQAYQSIVKLVWQKYGPMVRSGWGKDRNYTPSYVQAQNSGVANTSTNTDISSQPFKLTPEQQRIVDDWGMKMKSVGDPDYEMFIKLGQVAPLKQWEYVRKQPDFNSYGYIEPNPYGNVNGNLYGSSSYQTQNQINWENKNKSKFGMKTIPNIKTISDAISVGLNPYDVATLFGMYPSGSGKVNNNMTGSSGTTYDKIVVPVTIDPTATVGISVHTNPTATSGTEIPTPSIPKTSGTAIPTLGIRGTSGTAIPTLGIRGTSGTAIPTPGIGGTSRTAIPTLGIRGTSEKRMREKLKNSNTKKFMGGKTGRMGPLIDDGVGDKGRYFEKSNTQKSQSRNAIKFYETDKTDNIPMSKSLMKALARKIHEINSGNYYGDEKPKRNDLIRKDGNFGASVNLGGTMNNYVSPNQKIPNKQMYELDTPRQKTPTPMGTSTMKKPMGGSLNAFNPYPRSGSMATGMGAPTMKRMTTQKTITRLSQKSLPQGMPKPSQKVSGKYR